MKKLLSLIIACFASISLAMAQQAQTNPNAASIKFDKTVHDFGSFSEDTPTQKCTFTFTNVGKSPLIINQAIGSCGCTVPTYTKAPVRPGDKGEIKVTYNGRGLYPGHFKKSITIRTNGDPSMVRLYIQGDMTDATPAKGGGEKK